VFYAISPSRLVPLHSPVANFNLAIDQGYGERKTTAWARVVVWGKQAENKVLGGVDLPALFYFSAAFGREPIVFCF
jgi:hypothetical protein